MAKLIMMHKIHTSKINCINSKVNGVIHRSILHTRKAKITKYFKHRLNYLCMEYKKGNDSSSWSHKVGGFQKEGPVSAHFPDPLSCLCVEHPPKVRSKNNGQWGALSS